MANKIVFAGLMGAIMTLSANAATTLATEPFVRSAITNAKLHADTAASDAADNAISYTDSKLMELGFSPMSPVIAVGTAAFEAKTAFDAAGAAATAETNAKAYTDTEVADKADKIVPSAAGNIAGLDATGNLTDSGVSAASLNALTGDVSGKADAVTGPGGTGTKITYNTDGIVTGSASAEIADVTGLQAALDAKSDELTYGAAGTVAVSNGTGFDWANVTGDTYTELP